MKLNNKTVLLAGAFVLASVGFIPQASAAVYDVDPVSLTDDDTGGFAAQVLSNGSFTDWFNFSLIGTSGLSGQANTPILSISGTTVGVHFSSFELYSGTGDSSVGALLATGTISSDSNSFFATLAAPSALSAGNYTIKVVGWGENIDKLAGGSGYSGNITTAPVPEPEEWAMMLVGAGLVSYQVRRKQKAAS